MILVLRKREMNPRKIFQDPAGIQTEDLLNTSLTTESLGPLAFTIIDTTEFAREWLLNCTGKADHLVVAALSILLN